MFDPTVFDNLKVVIEGDLYDLDLEGVLTIVGRKDVVDLANMSRTFSLKVTIDQEVFGEIILSSDIENLSGEILGRQAKPGCQVKLVFLKRLSSKSIIHSEGESWKNELAKIWVAREIHIFSTIPLDPNEMEVELKAEIRFNRLIHEENMDDLRELLTFMVKSIN